MKIKRDTLKLIFRNTKYNKKESGGALGESEGVIFDVVFDKGLSDKMCTYEPNVNLLNSAIEKWQENNIAFAGIFHTHFFGVNTLSSEDIAYIKQILRAMPDSISNLCFPLVLPEKEIIIPYTAKKNNNDICIIEDILTICE